MSTENITSALKEATNDLLTEETLSLIEDSFNGAVEEKVSLHVEKALIEQDEDHAVKLEKLLESIDKDHTEKLQRIVEAVTRNHTQKLKTVAEKFNHTLTEEAGEFKDGVVDKISNYLDLYIDDAIPTEDIQLAMHNNHAAQTLNDMRSRLAVDKAMVTESIRDAVLDGKKQIDETAEAAKSLGEKNEELLTELIKTKSSLILEQMTKDLPEQKKKYMYKVLVNKTPEFITENFDYTLRLLEKTEEERLREFEEQAKKTRTVSVDRTTVEQTRTIVEEKVQAAKAEQTPPAMAEPEPTPEESPLFNTYMGELGKY